MTTFCPLPWNHLSTRSNGDIRLCCHANVSDSAGLLRKPDGTTYNLARDSLYSARNSDLAKEVRRSMLTGEQHPACSRCWDEEASGLRSRRHVEQEQWGGFTQEMAQALTAPDGSVPADFRPVYYDLRFGNLCNLACRMCGPADSNSWYDDHVAMTGKEQFKDHSGPVALVKNAKGRYVEPTGMYEWDAKGAFWDEMRANIDSVEFIFMVGGEPLLIEPHYDFLQYCVDQGRAGSITLEFITNVTNIHRRAVELWPHFKQVRIGLSVDGVGAVNDYVRYPSRWTAVERNLRRVDELGANCVGTIHASISALNIYYLDEFIRWKITQDFRIINNARYSGSPIFRPHPVHRPRILNVKTLPREAKVVIADKLATVVPWAQDYATNHPHGANLVKGVRAIVDAYTNLMMAEDWADQHLGEFWAETRKLDALRGQSIETSLPELYDLIRHTEPRR